LSQADDNINRGYPSMYNSTFKNIFQSSRTVPRNQNASDTLVVIGGAPRYKCDSASDDVMTYNLTSETWESVTTLPEPRHHHASKFLLYVVRL
jgi:hypothetical protein